MMTKFAIVLSTLLLAMTGINAQRGGPRRGGRPAPGPGLRPGPFYEGNFVDLSNVCTDVNPAEPVCALRNGEAGAWLCLYPH